MSFLCGSKKPSTEPPTSQQAVNNVGTNSGNTAEGVVRPLTNTVEM